VDEPVRQRLARVEAPAGEKQPHGLVHAELREHDDGDHRGDHAHANLAEGERGSLDRDGDVACRDQPHPAAEGVAVRRHDHRLRPVPHALQDRNEWIAAAATLRDRGAAALQVRSRAEDGPGAGENDDTDRSVVAGAIEPGPERIDHGTRQRVARGG
jgi:hypothetical protein